MIINENLTAVILAGGKSKRFGSTKSLARYKNKTLISVAVDLAFKLSDKVMIMGGNNHIPAIHKVDILKDIFINLGPIGGIHSALKNSKTHYIAVLPVDMPLLCPDIYFKLFQYQNGDQPVAAISKKGLEPLVSVWSQNNRFILEKSIKENKLSIWNAMNKLNTIKVDFNQNFPTIPDECFFNINTEADLQLLKTMNFKANNDIHNQQG